MEQIYKYIGRQFKNPTGFGGKISALIMNIQNQKQYRAIIENIDIQTTDTILDIGFGNGYLIHRLSKKNPQKIYGIDISPDMLNTAKRKNRKKIEQGKIELLLADIHNIPLDDCSINKAYTVNTIYFWHDVQRVFSEIKRVLKPNGIFLNVLYLKELLDKLPVTQYGYSKYTTEQIETATSKSGLKIEQIIEIQHNKSICVIARNVQLNL
jgi:ubiquinone/menaquinone biosynthesis C-methylase UbiE